MENKEIRNMSRAEEIIRAVVSLWREGNNIFSRKDVRDQIGVSQEKWLSGYTAIFQGMRADRPGGAPLVSSEFQDVFRQVRRGKHTLTDYGKKLLEEY